MSEEKSWLPFVSIIIPMLNAESTIDKCLQSIQVLDYPQEKFEVILIDNGSSDASKSIGERYGVTVLDDPYDRVGGLRNFGARHARGDVFAFTDSDCILPNGWLRKSVQLLSEKDRIGAVGGGCLVPRKATWVEKAWAPSSIPSGTHLTNSLPACNFILIRELFEELGGFREDLIASEDDELSFRIRKMGLGLLACGELFVIHLGYPKTLWFVTKRQIWHGKAAVEASTAALSRIFFMTIVFLFSFLALPISVVMFKDHPYFIIINMFLLFSSPVLHTLTHSFRIRRWRLLFELYEIVQLFSIYFAFYVGRSIGLLMSYKVFLRIG